MLEESAERWRPTHVQVTVLQARNLPPKGKNGGNDTFTIIQLGREKYSTSVLEKSLHPVWEEEAAFELPGAPDSPEQLTLTVMHRSLVGMDKFLGHVTINLSELLQRKERQKTEWYKLESKPNKRKKERGDVKVNIQFMRNNMTASMFDLSMKDKSRSPFTRLKDKMKKRKADGSDTSSAIIPSIPSHLHGNGGFTGAHKRKPNKPFLLGPQRLSSAHSMSDLVAPPTSGGPTATQPIGSAEESGGLKSPHRRTMSEDASTDSQAESSAGQSHRSSLTPGQAALSGQKFATLPRQWAPGDERSGTRDGSSTTTTGTMDGSSTTTTGTRDGSSTTTTGTRDDSSTTTTGTWEGKRDGRKKDKVSLLERVTGKKDARRGERHSQDLSDWSTESRRPEPPGYQSTNPFRVGSHPPEPRSFLSMFEVSAQAEGGRGRSLPLHGLPDQNPLEVSGLYSHLTRPEVERELLKHKELLKKKDSHIRELEDYIDNLLVRVMEETPSILRVPYVPSRRTGKLNQQV